MIFLLIFCFKVTDRTGQICSQAAFYLLSIVWSPKFREVQIQGNYAKGKCPEDINSCSIVNTPEQGNDEIPESSVIRLGTVESRNSHQEQDPTVEGEGIPVIYSRDASHSHSQEGNVTGRIADSIDDNHRFNPNPSSCVPGSTVHAKVAIISSFCKLFFIPVMAVIFSQIFDIVHLKNISNGFRDITTSNPSFLYFILHIVTSFFGYNFGWLACSLGMHWIGYALPLMLATPISVIAPHLWKICEKKSTSITVRTKTFILYNNGRSVSVACTVHGDDLLLVEKSRGESKPLALDSILQWYVFLRLHYQMIERVQRYTFILHVLLLQTSSKKNFALKRFSFFFFFFPTRIIVDIDNDEDLNPNLKIGENKTAKTSNTENN